MFLKYRIAIILLIVIIIGIASTFTFCTNRHEGNNSEYFISKFNQNFSVFTELKEYLSKQNKSVIIDKNENGKGYSSSNTNVDLSPVDRQINFLFDTLGFEIISVHARGINIRTGIINSMEESIIYYKVDLKKVPRNYIKIRDNWYYHVLALP